MDLPEQLTGRGRIRELIQQSMEKHEFMINQLIFLFFLFSISFIKNSKFKHIDKTLAFFVSMQNLKT